MIQWAGGRRPSTPHATVKAMCEDMARRTTKTPRTLRFYRESCNILIKTLEALGLPSLPWDIRQEHIKKLMDHWIQKGLTVSSRRSYISALRTWMHYWHNMEIDGMEIRWPVDTRPTIDWLDGQDAIRLISLDMTPLQEIIIHCELCLGMRRVELLRSKVSDWNASYVDILGKGPQGGKPRRMPYHPDTPRILKRYLHYRDQLIVMGKIKSSDLEVPDQLLIYLKGSCLLPYSPKGSGIDGILLPLEHELGRHFSNHTLRRTFGRMMYRSGVEVATISAMMGHESQDTTLRYIGVNLDDMTDAMAKFCVRS